MPQQEPCTAGYAPGVQYGAKRLGPTTFVNASIWDSRHRPVNEPVVIDVDAE